MLFDQSERRNRDKDEEERFKDSGRIRMERTYVEKYEKKVTVNVFC